MMMDREGRALPGASSESRESEPKRSLQEERRDFNMYACPSAPAGFRTDPGLDSSESIVLSCLVNLTTWIYNFSEARLEGQVL